MSARKDDTGKLRYDLIPPDALRELARVYTIGANKYEARNWEKGMSWGRVFGALMRHAWAFWRGERFDPVDSQHHLSSVAWCALALLSYDLRGIGEDDRGNCEEAAQDGDTWDRPPLNLHGVDETGDYVEVERENDGRWIAEIPSMPGVMVYGDTEAEACRKVAELASEVRAAEAEFTHDAQCFTRFNGGECDCPNNPAAPSHPDIKTGFDFPKFPTHGETYCPIGSDQRWRYEGNGQWVNLSAFTENGQPKSGEMQFAGSVGKYEGKPERYETLAEELM